MIPPASNPQWAKLLKGEATYTYKFLALKIALTRLQQKVKADPSQLGAVTTELVAFFTKNQALMADDIKTIFG